MKEKVLILRKDLIKWVYTHGPRMPNGIEDSCKLASIPQQLQRGRMPRTESVLLRHENITSATNEVRILSSKESKQIYFLASEESLE